MLNRILGILILLIALGLGTLFYLYFFVYSTSTLIVSSNIAPFSFTLKTTKLSQKLEFNCESLKCSYPEVSPFSYELTPYASGYISETQNFSLPSSSSFGIDIVFDKKRTLMPLSPSPQVLEKTQNEKVALLRQKKSSYAFFEVPDFGYFSFDEKEGSVELSYQSSFSGPELTLGTFDRVPVSEISILPFLGERERILLKNGKESYFIISLKDKSIIPLTLGVDITAIKQGETLGEYLLVTQVGTYIYDVQKEKPEYFSQFYDFVYSPDRSEIIGFVGKDDITKRSNLGLEDMSQDVIVSFNRSTMERKVMLKLQEPLVSLYQSGSQIIVVDKKGSIYELKGL